MFPREKYKYFTNNENMVIAEQTFAGKKYRGTAKLKSPDVFNYDIGKNIAAAKCDLKICTARYDYSRLKLKEAEEFLNWAKEEYEKYNSYYEKSKDELFDATIRLNETLVKNGV